MRSERVSAVIASLFFMDLPLFWEIDRCVVDCTGVCCGWLQLF